MMNYIRTGMLMAGLTALFGAVGYLLGGSGGMLMALGFAAVDQSLQLLELRPAGAGRPQRP